MNVSIKNMLVTSLYGVATKLYRYVTFNYDFNLLNIAYTLRKILSYPEQIFASVGQ